MADGTKYTPTTVMVLSKKQLWSAESFVFTNERVFGTGMTPDPIEPWRRQLFRFAVDHLGVLDQLVEGSAEHARAVAAYQLLHLAHELAGAAREDTALHRDVRDLLKKHRGSLRAGFFESSPPSLGELETEWERKVQAEIVDISPGLWAPKGPALVLAKWINRNLHGSKHRDKFGTVEEMSIQFEGVLMKGQAFLTTDRNDEPLPLKKVSAKLLVAVLKKPHRPCEAFGEAGRKKRDRADAKELAANIEKTRRKFARPDTLGK